MLRAKSGDRDALEELVGRHQAWIYNIAFRMLYHPQVNSPSGEPDERWVTPNDAEEDLFRLTAPN